MLPLVSAIVQDICQVHRSLCDREDRLKRSVGKSSATPMHLEEVEAFEESINEDRSRLAEYINELSDLGVVLKAIDVGGVSFPSVFRGRLVFLSWLPGDREIRYWHELDTGFAGRESIDSLLPELLFESLRHAD
ncbi:DUF2203 domain-containing protein [bacterium]|nr:DUF2203 domain-containing protein [bacterium]